MTLSAPPAPRQHQSSHRAPVLNITRYDRVSSFLMAAVTALLVAVFAIIALVPTPRSDTPPNPGPVLTLPGGFEQGELEETLRIDSPETPIPNASALHEDQGVDDRLETVTELAETATRQLQQLASYYVADRVPGSLDGTGGPPLGDDGFDGPGGPEQRWYIQFSEAASLDEYARQLEFFEIEPAALFLERGELVYLSDLTSSRPTTRVVTTADDERLYMTWQGGGRRMADAKLFERADVDVSGAALLHFYPPRTEELLARLEQSFANRAVNQIRRTYFVVTRQGNGYTFAVTRQHYRR